MVKGQPWCGPPQKQVGAGGGGKGVSVKEGKDVCKSPSGKVGKRG